MSKHIVPVTTEVVRFKQHLNLDSNIRILFSAPFGAGKSSFIDTFFSDTKDYLAIKIFPTNYSVASNKDIFELIKFDILSSIFEDFSNYVELDKEEFSAFVMGQVFVSNQMDFLSLSQAIAKAIIPKAKEGIELVNVIKEIFETFKNYKDDLKRTDEDSIIEYLVSFRMKSGSIKEQDFFTQKIKQYLNLIRDATNKKLVLVIDDLDRLDAEHVFRLFNIFTAHHDSKLDKNKFGFDKIIMVCDINTVEHLFFHKYGSKAEFNGYIDKFYSHFIFRFNNKKYLKENINKLISQKNDLAKNHGGTLAGVWLSLFGYNQSDFYTVFHNVISDLIEIDLIKIRNFQRFQEYSLPHTVQKFSNNGDFLSDEYSFLVLMHLLNQFFPRLSDLEAALISLYKNYNSDYKTGENYFDSSRQVDSLLIKYSLPFLGATESLTNDRKENKVEFTSEQDSRIIIIFQNNNSTLDDGIEYLRCVSKIELNTNEGKYDGHTINRPNPYWFLYKAYLECRKRRYTIGLNER